MYEIGFVCETEDQAKRLRSHVKTFFEMESKRETKDNTVTTTDSKIGLVKLRTDTDDKTWRQMEEFFISKGLFISSVPKGIMVTDVDKAKELIEKMKDDEDGNPFCEFCQTYHSDDEPCPDGWY